MNTRERNTKRLVPILVLTLAIVIGTIVAGGGISFTKGQCIKTDSDSYMIVMDNSPVKMSNSTNHKNPFGKFSTGDEILIIHGPVAESYPGQTQVHWAIKLGGGDTADIPADIITSLEDMGWIIIKE